MPILDRIRQFSTAADVPVQKPGRHSTVGLVERLTRELAELRESRDREIRGYQQALQQAGRDVQEARGRSDYHARGWKAADAEVQRLKRLLSQDAGIPATAPQPAVADTDGSCFNEPDPQPVTEGPRAVADTPVVAETYEPADPNAETQAVPQLVEQTQRIDVRQLRDAMGMGRTAVIPIVPVAPPTEIPAGPGSTDPTEVSQATGIRATVRVSDAMEEAS